jgi:NTE family protein
MHIAATNVADGRYQIFDEGNLHLAVLASCCMPVIFTPVFVNGEYYIDAGLVNNLPVEPILDCKCIVGIHTNPIQSGYTKLGTRGMLERSFLLAINGNVKLRRDRCHIYLEPQFLGEYRVFDFKKVREIYQRSQKWINERLPTLLQDIEQQMSQTG